MTMNIERQPLNMRGQSGWVLQCPSAPYGYASDGAKSAARKELNVIPVALTCLPNEAAANSLRNQSRSKVRARYIATLQ